MQPKSCQFNFNKSCFSGAEFVRSQIWIATFLRIKNNTKKTRVADPHSFHPDPAFLAEYRSGSRALMSKKWGKLQRKNNNIFGAITSIYLFLGLHKERPSYRRSLQLSKEDIQPFKHETF
jgi:hypothetical protein